MATSNKDMGAMLRSRRAEMSAIPGDAPYTGPDSAEETPKPTKSFEVAAPGDPSTGDQFEYEPFTDLPGAWVIYPPGVPCDDTEYRIRMSNPAGADDFAKMQKALDDAEGESTPDSESSEPTAEAADESGGY